MLSKYSSPMKNFLLILLILLAISCEKKLNDFESEYISKITESGNIPKTKRGFEVTINKRLNETELENLGNRLYQYFDGNKYSNFFVNYYLDGMIIGNGSYASTHFTPELAISITGLTENDIENITNENFNEKRYWIDDGWKNIIAFRKENNNILIKRYFPDLTKDQKTLKLKIENNDTLFIVPDRTNGEYYKINSDGELEQYDN